jgi:hypothetical protein
MASTVATESRALRQVPLRLLPGFESLIQARTYALDLGRNLWDFAVEIVALHALGLNNNDLRWLICHGCIEHAIEISKPRENGRKFQRGSDLTLTERACFVLTDLGADWASQVLGSLDSQSNDRLSTNGNGSARIRATIGPQWDCQLREFRFADRTIKTFRLPSPNQQTVLTAFEEENWPQRIDDPLPPDPTICPKRRLHDTIKSLNRNQQCRLVRFSGDGTGQGVCWEPILENCHELRLH